MDSGIEGGTSEITESFAQIYQWIIIKGIILMQSAPEWEDTNI